MSFLNMLNPAEGLRGIKKFVLQCIFESGAKPCPPMIVGIGLGGTSDVAMQLAKEASTFRKIGSSNPDPDVAALERELLDKINQTGIGPQGLGATSDVAMQLAKEASTFRKIGSSNPDPDVAALERELLDKIN